MSFRKPKVSRKTIPGKRSLTGRERAVEVSFEIGRPVGRANHLELESRFQEAAPLLRARDGLDGYANLGVGFEVDRAVKPNHAAVVGTGQSDAHDRKYTFVEIHSGRLGLTVLFLHRDDDGRGADQRLHEGSRPDRSGRAQADTPLRQDHQVQPGGEAAGLSPGRCRSREVALLRRFQRFRSRGGPPVEGRRRINWFTKSG
jgi:hypothetical protein